MVGLRDIDTVFELVLNTRPPPFIVIDCNSFNRHSSIIQPELNVSVCGGAM